MATTTIRVDTETHDRLRELSRESGASLTETVRQAADALTRQRFGRKVAAEFEALRSDPVAWAEYLAEAEDTAVADDLD